MSDGPDTVVVGTGPAGLLHAVLLAGSGRRVTVVGAARAPRAGTFELLGSRAMARLDEVGLGAAVRRVATPCVGTVFRWTDRSFREHAPAAGDDGWVIDRAELDPLVRRWAGSCGVTLHRGTVGRVWRRDGDWALVVHDEASGPGVLATPALVLATGRGSRIAARLGLAQRSGPATVAVTTVVPHAFGRLGARLLVDAAEDGWWYALGDGLRATVGFVTDAARVPASGGLTGLWRRAARSAEWLPESARRGPVRGRRAAVHASDAGDEALQVIGDAALAPDPLSGHGIALALDGAKVAAHEPAAYADWLAAREAEHRAAGVELYRTAAMDGAFWRRRTG